MPPRPITSMTSYFPILAGTFDAMTERCQFAENERPFHRHLPRSPETSEREKERAPGRGYFATKALGPQLMDVMSRRIPVGTAVRTSSAACLRRLCGPREKRF